MLNMLKLLLFSNMVLLTPEPIDIKGEVEFNLNEPISALTEGAAMYVDVSSMIPPDIDGVVEFRRWVDKEFEVGDIKVSLVESSGGNRSSLYYHGESAWSKKDAYIILSSDEGIPTGKTFNRVVLKAERELLGVDLIWKNYKK